MSARLRREIACGAVSQSKPEQGGVRSAQIELGGVSLVFFLSVNTALACAFDSPAPAGRDVSTSDNGGDERQPASSETRPYPKGLDLLLDVELPVSLSFGRAEPALRDVIKLTTGSIVELNRSLAEPVEVIVNNVVIARGEVVVVEGNFGVRIKEVISRQERLRTLR
jgi:flagellar motor switch protein FliN/FliY